jgi:hypothetical protein
MIAYWHEILGKGQKEVGKLEGRMKVVRSKNCNGEIQPARN